MYKIQAQRGDADQLNGILMSAFGTLAAALVLFLTTLLAATVGSAVVSYLPFLAYLPVLSRFGSHFSKNLSWMVPYAMACLVLHKMLLSTLCEKLQSFEGDLSKVCYELCYFRNGYAHHSYSNRNCCIFPFLHFNSHFGHMHVTYTVSSGTEHDSQEVPAEFCYVLRRASVLPLVGARFRANTVAGRSADCGLPGKHQHHLSYPCTNSGSEISIVHITHI